MFPYILSIIITLLTIATAEITENTPSEVFICDGPDGAPILYPGETTPSMGIYTNISCSRVRFDLLNDTSHGVYYANISDETCPNELYQDITAPDIDYEGEVKITYECNTEFGDPCQVLSMLQRTSSPAKPTSRLAKSVFSISQFCNTTAPLSNGTFGPTSGITNVNLRTSAAALQTEVITGAVSTFSAIESAEDTVSTSSSLPISNPGATPIITSSPIAASNGLTGTIAEISGTTARFTVTQDPVTDIPSRVTTGIIGSNGACTCSP